MAIIRTDNIGPYVFSGGYVARPLGTTAHNIGSTQTARHNAGSPRHIVGGEWWFNSDVTTEHYASLSDAERRERWEKCKRQLVGYANAMKHRRT